MWYLIIVFIILVAGVQWLKAANLATEKQARELIQQGALLVDVRTEAEYTTRSVKGTTNIPLDRFEGTITKTAPDKTKPLLLHCRSGSRSASALRIAQQLGYTNVYNLGGFNRAKTFIEPNR